MSYESGDRWTGMSGHRHHRLICLKCAAAMPFFERLPGRAQTQKLYRRQDFGLSIMKSDFMTAWKNLEVI